MRKLIHSIRHTYYNCLMDLAMWKIKSHTKDDKVGYWVKMLCKYATKSIGM